MAHLRAYLRAFSVLVIVVLVASQGLIPASADLTPHALCPGGAVSNFIQDWTNTGLITANDDWSGVPNIIGYRGDGLTVATGVDPQTVLGDGTAVVDINANQTNPNTFTTGGVTEFEIANPVVALAGSGTADAPHLVLTFDSTGTTSASISYTVRDIDLSGDNSTQPLAVQYRVGTSGSWTNIPSAYIADASVGPNGGQNTSVSAYALPAGFNDAGTVQIRFITTDAVGNDEWIGIDNIVVTPTCGTGDPCDPIIFPYTLPNNARNTLVTAIECANANGASADVIDLNGFAVALFANNTYASYQAPTGLPQITTDITLRDGTIQHDLSGGGFLFRTFDIAAAGTLNLVNMTLLGDSAPTPGGAFYNFGTLNVIGSTMTGYDTNNRGGVLFNGSGATANFTNALFYNNNAVNAHVMDNNGSVTIINSTFDKHTSISNFGSILEGSGYVIRNSIFWNPGSGPNQIQAGNTVSDSIVKGGYSGGTNILNTDPLFVNEGGNDFRLQLTSPAVNMGVNTYVPTDTFDIDGDSNTAENTPDLDLNPRIAATVVDMGAYERQDAAPPDPCAAITFPYTLPNNAPATLITAMECANANGAGADVINLNGQTVTLTDSFGNFSGATGLPQVTTNITVRNGTITRTGSNEFRFFNVSNTGNLTVRDMTLTNGGGVAYANDGGSIISLGTSSTLTVINTTISGSRVENLRNGSAIYSNAIFTIVNSSVVGGGFGRGAIASNNGPALIQNTLIAGNSGPTTINGAGGVYFGNMASATIENSTIVGNYTNITTATQPGGVFASGGTVNLTIRNSIIWGNRNIGNTAPQVVNATAGTNTVTNSIIEGGIFGALNSDPLFVTPITASATPSTAGNFQLSDGSPAIDAGANANVPADTFDVNGNSNTSENAPDLAGSVRRYDDTGVADTGTGTAPIVDMGAYEKQTNSPIDPCAAITFPYTLPNNLAATLITAIECANANGAGSDTIDLDGQIVTLTASYADYTGATGLPQITTTITLENGTITRSGGAPQFRLLNVGATGSLTVDGLTVSGGSLSSSDNAGAIFNDGGTLNILNSTVTNNSAGFGGAIYNSGAASVITITDSTLSSNSATENGGFMISDGGSVTILRSTVSGNSASGVVGNGAIYNFEADLDIIETAFINNTSTTSVGAIQNFNGTTNIANSVFTGNSASINAGAVINNAGGVMSITNSQFTGNSAVNTGGAVFNNVSSTLTMTNSTFAGNNATTSGGIHLASSTATITNSIVWGNSSNTLTGATITYSVIQGGFAGTGNLNVDPLFVAPVAFTSAPTSTGNYRLQDNSPAVDAGSNAAVPVDTYDLNDNVSTTDEAPDLASNPRRYDDTGVTDTGSGTAPLVDMGAYEKQTNSPVAFPEDVDYCNLQFPTSFTAAAGSTSPIIYGRVYEDDNGVLTSSPGAHPSIVGQLGYGPLGSDPRGGNPAWQWFPTTYNVQVGNDDEYQGTFTVPFAPTNTQLSYTYRFSVDSGANYTYCDSDGNGTNNGLEFSTANLGTLTISPGGQPTISINDVALNEGNSGTTNFIFTISLNGPSLNPVTFDIATADNTATVANSDYVANGAADVTLSAGQTSTTFTIVVNGDTTFEPNETFFVNLVNVVGATIGDGQGTGTIVNDDVDPCFAYSFPYTLAGNTPAELIQAINCANLNGPSADTINLNGQTVTLTASYANVAGTNIGLPEITTPITVQNGTITRSSANLFRFFLNNSTLNLNNLTLSNANSQGDGGAIVNSASSVLNINNSRIIGNYGNFGGAIFNSNTGTTTLTNTLVAGNRSNSQGGGIRNRGNLILNNSTVAGNFTTSGAEGGGGIANAGTYTLTLNNSIVYGNESSSFPGANEMVGTFTSNNSLVGVNPSFVAPLDASNTAPTTSGDYRLAAFSVAIDAGDNSLIPGVTTDLDGNPRRINDTGVADTGVGSAPIVDLGAYERQTNSVLQADLSITKTDGVTTAVPGGSVTYTITASNAGPNNAPSATVADTFPAILTGTWTCVGAGGGTCTAAGSGNISDTVNLPAGGSVTYTVTATISASATGTLSNTATVSSGVTDPVPGNNSATDTDTLTPQADLSITKTDGQTSATPGTSVTYTIVASNAGPSNAPSATVADTFPASLTGVTWTCVGAGGGTCTAAGSGNISDTVNLPVGGSVTYTVTATISASATGTLSNTATVSTAVTDPNPGNNSATDTTTLTAPAGVTVTPTTVNVTEGGATDTYTLVLDIQPSSDVTVELSYGGQVLVSTDGVNFFPSPVTVTFTSANWDSPRTITVQAFDDFAVEGAHNTSIDHDVTSADPLYNGLSVASVTANITDNDAAGVVITESSGTPNDNAITVTEGGAGSSFAVVLTSQPASDVQVSMTFNGTIIEAGSPTLGNAPFSITFTSGNWNIPQIVNVGVVNDNVEVNHGSTNLSLVVGSADPNYTSIPTQPASPIVVTIIEDDAAGVVITESSGTPNDNAITVTEGGAGSSFAVVLTSQPASDVQVSMTFNGTIIEVGSPTLGNTPFSITFTSGNWNIPQIVNVGAVNDNVEVNHGSTNLSLVVGSADPNYTSIPTQPASPIVVTIIEDDAAGVTVTPTTVNVTEGGATASYSVVLNTIPTGDVTITVTGDAQASASPTSLTFTTGNWNVAQNVTVTAVDDLVVEGAHTGTITHSAAGGGYTGVSIASVTANITDNDTAGVTVSPTTVNVTEGGATATYGVSLNTQPTGDVTITVAGDAQASASPATLTFTTANWNIAQNVTVTAVDDLVVEGAHTGTITHSAAGGGYDAVSIASVTANITDNDVAAPTDLLLNGGFELGREGQPTLARNWVVVAPSVDNDIRFCKAAGAPQIYEGVCSFRFSFSGTIVNGTARSLTQTITAPVVSAGDSLTLTAYVRAANLINRPRLLVRAIYADGTSQRIRINITEGSYGYTEFTGSVTLTGTPTSIRVIVQPRTSEGVFFVDGMSLKVNATPPTRTSAPDSGLLSLPPAP